MKPPEDATSVWRPGSRMARLRAGHNFGVVVLLVVGTFVFIAAAPDEPWAAGVVVLLQGVTLVLAIWTSGLGQDRRPMFPLVTGAMVAAAGVLILSSDTVTGLAAVLNIGLVVATIAVVGIGIADQRDVSVRSLTGALCVYLLLGMSFFFIYGAVAIFGDGPFFSNGSDGTSFERLYFSYVTLATLGYGDYTAGGTLGRSLAIAEVLMGQLFLVTAVALLVGLLVSRRGEPTEGGP